MLFTQVKSFAYSILVTIVACQLTPGTYTIMNHQFGPNVLATSPNPGDALVIVKRPIQGPDRLAEWDISPDPQDHFFIKNVETGAFLSDNGGRAILANEPFPWTITDQDGLFSIASPIRTSYLSIIPDPVPRFVTLTTFSGPSSEWDFIPIPGP